MPGRLHRQRVSLKTAIQVDGLEIICSAHLPHIQPANHHIAVSSSIKCIRPSSQPLDAIETSVDMPILESGKDSSV